MSLPGATAPCSVTKAGTRMVIGAKISSMTELASYEKRIREMAPDVAVNSVSLNRDGLLNDIVIVNDELVFRFPKHEYAFNI